MSKTSWAIDPTHSEIGFKVKHMMFTTVSGNFEKFSASVETEGDDFSSAQISFEADINSISTKNSDRDAHLKSPDFFDAAQFSSLQFTGAKLSANSGNQFTLTGNLSIKGISHPVSLSASYSGMMKDPWGNTKVGFSIEGNINRKDFGLNWNAALEAGGVLVSEEVKLFCEIQLVKQ